MALTYNQRQANSCETASLLFALKEKGESWKTIIDSRDLLLSLRNRIEKYEWLIIYNSTMDYMNCKGRDKFDLSIRQLIHKYGG